MIQLYAEIIPTASLSTMITRNNDAVFSVCWPTGGAEPRTEDCHNGPNPNGCGQIYPKIELYGKNRQELRDLCYLEQAGAPRSRCDSNQGTLRVTRQTSTKNMVVSIDHIFLEKLLT